MKLSKITYLICAVVLSISQMALSQSNPSLVKAKILKNTDFVFEVESATLPTGAYNEEFSNVEQIQYVDPSGSPYTMRAIIENDFIGTAFFAIEWYSFAPPVFFTPHLTFYEIEVVEAIIETEVDIVTISEDDTTVEIYPLENDYAENAPLELIQVAQVMYGSATVTDSNTVIYTRNPNHVGPDYMVYSVTDTIDESDVGNIIINVLDPNPELSETLYFTITDVQSQLLVFPFDGLTVDSDPNMGSLDSLSAHAYRYNPEQGAVGNDTLHFSSEFGYEREVIVNVIPVADEPDYAVDDYYYTPLNATVTVTPLENDVKNTFTITEISEELEYVGPGEYTYTPPTDFEGLKSFYYTVDYGTGTATGNIYVNIGNYEPQTSINYSFVTPEEEPLVIKYEVPLEDYEFTTPSFNTPNGFVMTYGESQNATLECDDVNGEAFFIYTPNPSFVGFDEFSVEYCTNSICKSYDVLVEVIAVNDDACYCVNDCVWEGDTNADGRVDVSDLLPIGRYMGTSGATREEGYGFWSAEQTENWTYNQYNGKNLKHADANGDGIITVTDTSSISAYYNELNNFVPNQVLTVKNYPFYLIPQSTEVDSGDLMVIDIILGSETYPVKDLHGLAFAIQIGPDFADSSSLQMEFYEDSWLTGVGPSLQMAFTPSDGRIETALTRTDGLPGSGYGVIGQLSFIVEDEADGIRNGIDNVYFGVKVVGATGEGAAGSSFYMPEGGIRIKLNDNQTEEKLDDDQNLVISPNPSSDYLNINLTNAGEQIETAILTDIHGRQVSKSSNTSTVDVSTLPVGVYILSIKTDVNIYTEKVQVIR